MGLEADRVPERLAWTNDGRLLTWLALHGLRQVDAEVESIEQFVADAREYVFRDVEPKLDDNSEEDGEEETNEPEATRRGTARAMRAVEEVCGRLRHSLRRCFVSAASDPSHLLERVDGTVPMARELDRFAFGLDLHLTRLFVLGVPLIDRYGYVLSPEGSGRFLKRYPLDLLFRVWDSLAGPLGTSRLLLELARRIRDEQKADAAQQPDPAKGTGAGGGGEANGTG